MMSFMFSNKTILVGVTISILSYMAVELLVKPMLQKKDFPTS